MNNKLTCHPEKPESGQQTNRQANLDTSTNQPTVDNYYWQNPRVCATCVFCHPVNDPFKCCPDNAAFCDCPTEYGGDGLIHNTYSDKPACPRYRATLTGRNPD